MSHGAKIAGFASFDLKPDRCVLHQNDIYHHLTEDREPIPINPQNPFFQEYCVNPNVRENNWNSWPRFELLVKISCGNFTVLFGDHCLFTSGTTHPSSRVVLLRNASKDISNCIMLTHMISWVLPLTVWPNLGFPSTCLPTLQDPRFWFLCPLLCR